MDQDLERSEVIELLVRLGEPEDEVVLQAARELHEKVSGAGFDWHKVAVGVFQRKRDWRRRGIRKTSVRNVLGLARERTPYTVTYFGCLT